MLLKGIILIFIGISGTVITIIWFLNSVSMSNKNKLYSSNNIRKDSHYSTGISDIMIQDRNIKPLDFHFQRQKGESTILLDDFTLDKETDETVLLEEEKSKTL